MRKIFLTIVVALLAISLAAPPASAVNLTFGDEHLAKLKDVSNLYSDKDPGGALEHEDLGETIDLGDEQRTLFQVTTIYDESGVVFDTSDPTELTGLLYDLKVLGTHFVPGGVWIDFGPALRNPLTLDNDGDSTGAVDPTTGLPIVFGGVLEVYEDALKNYTQDPGGVGDYDDKLPAPIPVASDPGSGPSFWTEGAAGHVGAAGADTFPGATEGTYWLAAAFVELQYLANIGVIVDPAGVGLGFAQGAVLREFIDFTAGSGHGFAYANIFGGAVAGILERNILPGFPLALVDLALLFNVNTPFLTFPGGVPTANDTLVYQGRGQWQVDSEDPMVFAVIPEPATMTLLGLSLLGLAGIRVRRKK